MVVPWRGSTGGVKGSECVTGRFSGKSVAWGRPVAVEGAEGAVGAGPELLGGDAEGREGAPGCAEGCAGDGAGIRGDGVSGS